MLQNYHYNANNFQFALPPAGLGTVKFGRNQDIKYPNAFDLPTDIELVNLLALAHELGINLLDTAPAYGISEQRLGKLLQQRQQWIISTKVGEKYNDQQSSHDFSAKAVTESIHASLKNLRTDYLDIVFIHSNGDDETILANNETVNALHKFKQAGVIRAIGLSGKTAAGGVAALTDYGMDIAMITHNPIYQGEQNVIAAAMEHKKPVFIKKAFASGHLEQMGNNPIQKAMDFVFSTTDTANLSVILGTINPKHLRENVVAMANSISKNKR